MNHLGKTGIATEGAVTGTGLLNCPFCSVSVSGAYGPDFMLETMMLSALMLWKIQDPAGAVCFTV